MVVILQAIVGVVVIITGLIFADALPELFAPRAVAIQRLLK
jgi:hypothetical protein